MITNGTEFADTVVIGGGQAGLAIGHELARQGRDFVILDAGHRVGDAWRQRWDSLRLFTPARFGLLGTPFPGDPLSFPTKDDVAAYLEDYAERFDLPIRTGVRADRVRHDGDRFVTTAGTERWESQQRRRGHRRVPGAPGAGLRRAARRRRRPAALERLSQPVAVAARAGARRRHGQLGSRDRPGARAHPPDHDRGNPGRRGARASEPSAARFVFPVLRFFGTPRGDAGEPARPGGVGETHHAAAHSDEDRRSRRCRRRRRPPHHGCARRPPGVRRRHGSRRGERRSGARAIGTTSDGSTCRRSTSVGEPRHRRGVVESVPGLYFLGLEFLYARHVGDDPRRRPRCPIPREADASAGSRPLANSWRADRAERAVGSIP